MPITVNFVAAIGRVSAGAISALPKVEAICAKYSGRVIGGVGSSTDPIVAEFADKVSAAQAANEAFHLDDVEDARVVGADVGVVEGTKTEAEIDKLVEGTVAERGIDDDMTGHDAHMEVHLKQGADEGLVREHLGHAMRAAGVSHFDHDKTSSDVIDDTTDKHPIHDYQPPEWNAKHTKGHTVLHVLPSAHFTDSDQPELIHKAVQHLRNSPAGAHISAVRVVHDYIADDQSAVKKPDAPKSTAGEWTEAVDAILAGKSAAEVIDGVIAAK